MNTKKSLTLIVGVMLAFSFAACDMGGDDPGKKGTPSEYLPDEERWTSWATGDSTATIDIEVDEDGLCTVTVGGTAMDATPAWDNVWKATVAYAYTAKKGKSYVYTFEAWTESGERTLDIQWYTDNSTNTYHNTGYDGDTELPVFTITSEPTTYTIKPSDYEKGPIPKSGTQMLEFHCANQTGTFYIKIISIGLPDSERWSPWKADDSTATIAINVGDDDVCAVTVGGTAMTGTPGWDNVWKVNAGYEYTAVKGKIYTFEFEAWTEGADRTMTIQWYNDWAKNVYQNTGYEEGQATFTITSERKTYTITNSDYGFGPIPKNGVQILEFQCANQTGKFNVKILSITSKYSDGDGSGGDDGGGTVGPKPPTEPTEVLLNGTWLEEGGTTMTIAEGNTITITSAEGELFGSGTFTINGNTIEVTFTEGEEEQIGTFTGTFSLSNNGNTLEMTIDDEETVWTRQP